MNDNLKEFQSILMKTVEEMIAKQMSVINLNMIHTIQSTLTRQTLQDNTKENHQSPNNISQSLLTQPPTLVNTTTNADTNIEDQPSSESTKKSQTLTPSETRMINFPRGNSRYHNGR